MKIIAVVGTGSNAGKTTLVCRLLEAIPGMGAIKISPHEGLDPGIEWGPGSDPGKDTARFQAAGAARVGRIVGDRGRIPGFWDSIRHEFEKLPGMIMEGGSSLAVHDDTLPVIVLGSSPGKVDGVTCAIAKSSRRPIIVANLTHNEAKSRQYNDILLHFAGIGEISIFSLSPDAPRSPLPFLARINAFLRERPRDSA